MIVRLQSIHNADRSAPAAPKSGIRKALTRGHLSLAAALLTAIPAYSQEKPRDLAEKSIEDLMKVEVTSVSKKEQKLSSVAAAIFVISQEDIRRWPGRLYAALRRCLLGHARRAAGGH